MSNPEVLEVLKLAAKDIERLVAYVRTVPGYELDSTEDAPLNFEPSYLYEAIKKTEHKISLSDGYGAIVSTTGKVGL